MSNQKDKSRRHPAADRGRKRQVGAAEPSHPPSLRVQLSRWRPSEGAAERLAGHPEPSVEPRHDDWHGSIRHEPGLASQKDTAESGQEVIELVESEHDVAGPEGGEPLSEARVPKPCSKTGVVGVFGRGDRTSPHFPRHAKFDLTCSSDQPLTLLLNLALRVDGDGWKRLLWRFKAAGSFQLKIGLELIGMAKLDLHFDSHLSAARRLICESLGFSSQDGIVDMQHQTSSDGNEIGGSETRVIKAVCGSSNLGLIIRAACSSETCGISAGERHRESLSVCIAENTASVSDQLSEQLSEEQSVRGRCDACDASLRCVSLRLAAAAPIILPVEFFKKGSKSLTTEQNLQLIKDLPKALQVSCTFCCFRPASQITFSCHPSPSSTS